MPTNSGDHQLLGFARYRAGQWAAAIRSLNEAANVRNEHVPVDALLLAMAHWQLGDHQQASHWFERAEQTINSRSPVGVFACYQPLVLAQLHAEATQLMAPSFTVSILQ